MYDEKLAEFYYSAGFLLLKNAVYQSEQKNSLPCDAARQTAFL
ncbi:hypothetical protein BATR1942_14375 [Bacillus atrophaeus 1942]|uniref:Uncharacterized protein n=1 Tax=Bacillus atrophaeus (strain 1942) TaxID=720555 RepID=A0ABN3ZHK8_BACA1|nr:hypothetical protein BATR1942_14375 [Bacillus atrophaeus 1942]EIM10864.1 hypothetical protein UY9_10487 [Bacillus atrophaeus C89]